MNNALYQLPVSSVSKGADKLFTANELSRNLQWKHRHQYSQSGPAYLKFFIKDARLSNVALNRLFSDKNLHHIRIYFWPKQIANCYLNTHTIFCLTCAATHNKYRCCRHKISEPDQRSTLADNIVHQLNQNWRLQGVPNKQGKLLGKNV